jgi:DHA1 family multidrug resistance protein-like MFS transporter
MNLAPSDSTVVLEENDRNRYPYWRRNAQILPVANCMTSMGFALSFPFLPVMAQSLGVRSNLETWMGNLMLLFYVISFAAGPVWGGIADHFGRKIMVLRAMLGMGLLMCLVPFAPSPLWFVLLFSLVGFFNGSSAAAQALLVSNTPPRRIGSVLARLQAGMLLGQTLGPAVATMAVAVVSRPHWLFWFSATLLLGGGLLVVVFVREVKQLATGPWKLEWVGSLRALVKVPGMVPLFLLAVVFAVLAGGNVTILSVYVLQLLGPGTSGTRAGAFWVGAVAMGLAVSSVISLLLWGRMLDRLQPARVLIFATTGATLTQIPLVFLETPLALVIARVAFGLGASLMQPAIVRLLKAYAPKGMDSRAISYSHSFHFVALGLAPFCAGLIGPVFGLRAYFALTIVFSLFVLALWMRTSKRLQAG